MSFLLKISNTLLKNPINHNILNLVPKNNAKPNQAPPSHNELWS